MQKILILIIAIISFSPIANSIAQITTPPIPMPTIDRSELTIKTAPGNQTRNGQASDEQIKNTIEPSQILNGAVQKLTLSAKISENSSLIKDSLTWRIFDASDEENRQMALLYKSDDSIVTFDLKPGDYLVHASYGFAQTSEAVQIRDSSIAKVINLEAGALRLSGAITGDISILPNNLSFDIKTSNYDSNAQTDIVTNIKENEIIYLNAGTYHITSYFGKINAVVKADIRVEAGQLTQATLYHNAAIISFKLASEQNGKAIADVEWSVKDSNGKIVYSKLGAFPFATLSEGDYSVIAKIGQKVYNRDFQVKPSAPRTIELLTSVY